MLYYIHQLFYEIYSHAHEGEKISQRSNRLPHIQLKAKVMTMYLGLLVGVGVQAIWARK